jgi:hypothetical protein
MERRVGIAWPLAFGFLGFLGQPFAELRCEAAQLGSSPRVEQIHHVHGLAIDPKDPQVLYVATHEGLLRHVEGRGLEHVGEARSDFMGFTHHPSRPGLMFASGHPHLLDKAMNPLGVIISADGGKTWRPLGLEGQVDLHAMTIRKTDGAVLYGWNVMGEPGLYRISASDGKATLIGAKALGQVYALAAHPTEARTLLAGTGRGLFVSQDEGQSWKPMAIDLGGVPVTVADWHPKNAAVLYAYAARADLGFIRSEDGGRTWKPLGWFLGERDAVGYLAISPHDPQRLFVATYGNDLLRSGDGGRTWTTLVRRGRPVPP